MTLRVVIATDGSERSIEAVRQAPEVLPGDAELVLVTAIPARLHPNEDATGFAGPAVTPDEADRIHRADVIAAHAALAATAAAFGPEPIRQEVLEGPAGEAICAFAEHEDAGMLVVGSHGKGFVAATVLGSVSSHLVRHAPCPVLVIRCQ